MKIKVEEFNYFIKITDLKMAKYIAQYNDNQYLDRIIGDVKYDEINKEFEGISFAIKDQGDEIINLIMQYECIQFLQKNQDKLFEKFIKQESEMYYQMNVERFEHMYLNDKFIKKIEENEEIKGEIN